MNEFAHLNSTSFLIFGRIFVGPQGETGPLTTIDRGWDGTKRRKTDWRTGADSLLSQGPWVGIR